MSGKKNHILLVVKSNYHAVLLQTEISSRYDNYTITKVSTLIDALQSLKTQNFKSIVIDLDIEQDINLSYLHEIRFDEPDIAIIVLVSNKTEEFAKRLFDNGIDELVFKDESFHVIVPRLIHNTIKRKTDNHTFDKRSVSYKKSTSEQLKVTAGTLSHEINNPLMTILGITELILDNPYKYDRNLLEKIKIVEKSAVRIQQSIKKLSNLSKPVFKRTVTGEMVDLTKSRIGKETPIPSVETE